MHCVCLSVQLHVQPVLAIHLRQLLCKGGKEGVKKAREILARWLRMVVGAVVGRSQWSQEGGAKTVVRIMWWKYLVEGSCCENH